jgi:hypothetical protein
MGIQVHTEERFPVITSMTQYIRADEVLAIAPLENETVAGALMRRIKAQARSANVDQYRDAQTTIAASDKPGFAYKVKLAALSWVDEETKRQMEEEALIQSRYVSIDSDDGHPEWDAHLTYPKTDERDAIVIDMDAANGGILMDFTLYYTKTGAPGHVLIAMDGPHPKIYVWSDLAQEDPTHIISLEKAYIGVRPIPREIT